MLDMISGYGIVFELAKNLPAPCPVYKRFNTISQTILGKFPDTYNM